MVLPLPSRDASSISEALHGLPHVDYSLNPVVNHFVLNSENYYKAVNVISYAPVAIILLLLFLLVLKSVLGISHLHRAHISQSYCSCRKQLWMYKACKICLFLLMICFLVEIVIFVLGLRALKQTFITTDLINNYRYGKDFDAQNTELLPGNALDFQKYGKKITIDRNDVLKNKTVRPYKYLFAKFLTELQHAWLKVMRPTTVTPRHIETPFMKGLRHYSVSRFLRCLVFWLTGFGILLCKPYQFWIVPLLALVWFCVTSSMLMKCAVMAADICHYPGNFIDQFTDMPFVYRYMTVERFYLCEQFLHHAIQNKPAIREIYFKWEVIFNVTKDRIIAEYDRRKKLKTGQFMYTTDNRYAYMISVCEFLKACHEDYYHKVHNVRFVSCRSTMIKDEDIPIDDIDSLCDGDIILKLLLLQLLLVLIIALLLIFMVLVHLAKTENIIKVKNYLNSFKKFSKKAGDKTASMILEQNRLYPPMIPPEECFKTCKHYKRMMELKRRKKHGIEYVEEEELVCSKEEGPPKQPGPLMKSKTLALTPPCAMGRKHPCCEPIKVVESPDDETDCICD